MTPQEHWRRCGKKRAFASQRRASRATKRHGHRVYKCPLCGRWHSTSQV